MQEGYWGVYQGKQFEVYAVNRDDAVNKAAALLKVSFEERNKIRILGTFIACQSETQE